MRGLSRRAFLVGLAGSAVTASACHRPVESASRSPNILFVSIDDLNDWVGFLGGHPDTRTPNLDRLAARGVVFEHAYCPVAACHPSRTSTLTGAFPPTTGVLRNADWMRRAFPDLETLPARFRGAGYRTLATGKIFHESHLTPHALGPPGLWDEHVPFARPPGEDPFPKPLEAPWNRLENPESFHARPRWIRQEDWAPVDRTPESMPDGEIADHAAAWLARDFREPFFLAVGFYRPHLPWYTPRVFFESIPERVSLPGRLEGDLDDVPTAGRRIAAGWGTADRFRSAGVERAAARAYLASIAFADWCVGRVLDALDEGPHAATTWVVLWSDNGFQTGEKHRWHKGTLWEPATRVPLVVVPPAARRLGPRRISTPVSLVDLYPTLCRAAGVAPPAHLEGTDLSPALAGHPFERPPVPIFLAGGHRALRFGRWKYIRYADGGEELYDIATDRDESTNRAGDASYADVLAFGRDELESLPS